MCAKTITDSIRKEAVQTFWNGRKTSVSELRIFAREVYSTVLKTEWTDMKNAGREDD